MLKKRKTNFLSLALAFSMLVSAAPSVSYAADGILSGDGSKDSPYIIDDSADLKAFRDKVNSGDREICAKLTNDIDLKGEEWTPIGGNDGFTTSYYAGTFDGNSKTVSNFTIDAAYNYAGFFSYVKGDVLNLSIKEATVNSSKNNAGGIAGTIIDGSIKNCLFDGSVNTTASNGYAGGIAGYLGNTKTTSPQISNCVNYGRITAKYAGGITSYAKYAKTIENCYNMGEISGKSRTGGIVGQNMNGVSVENCYSAGTLSGTGIGGIAGWNGVSITNCFWEGAENIQSGGNGKATGCEQITDKSALAAKLGDAFADDEKNTNNGYPLLKWQNSGTSIEKNPKIQINGNGKLNMNNNGTPVMTTLTVDYIDMDDEPQVTWSVKDGSDIITLEAPDNVGENNAKVVVYANKPGKATVIAAAGEFTAEKEISITPLITGEEIKGTVAVGSTVSAKITTLDNNEYDYANYPDLNIQWRYITQESLDAGNTDAYQLIPNAFGYEFTIPQSLEGNYLSFEFWFDGEKKYPSPPTKIVSSDEGVLNEDKSALNIGENKDIKQETTISLPDKGKNGSLIEWSSSDNTIISESGKVTLPEDGISQVTLTATLTYKGYSTTKDFVFNVYSQKKIDEEKADKLLSINKALDKLGNFYKMYPVYGTDKNVAEMFKAALDKNTDENITVSVSKVEEVYGGADISENGSISYFYTDPNSTPLIHFGSFKVTFLLSLEDAAREYEVPVIINWDADKVKSVMKSEILDKTELEKDSDGKIIAESNLSLPKTIDGKKWTLISWQSSDENVISISNENQQTADTLFDPYVGVVKKGTSEKAVTLTALFTFGYTNDIAGNEAPIYMTKVFEVTVPALGSEEVSAIQDELSKKLDSGFAKTPLTDAVTRTALEENDGVYTAENDILFPTTRDFGIDGKYYPVRITSSDEEVIASPDVNNAARVEVIRPAVGKSDKQAEITVSITDKNTSVSASKTFKITVPALTQEEIDSEKALMSKVKAAYFDGIKGSNSEADNISSNLSPFTEVYEKDGELVWVRSNSNMINRGIVPVSMDGWEELEAWRLFKSSNPAVIAHENLLVTRQPNAKAVTITSALSSETLGRYGKLYASDKEKYADYADLADLYYQTVSADVVVRGFNTKYNSKPQAVKETVKVTFRLEGVDDTLIDATIYDNLDETSSAFDVFKKALAENGYTYKNKGSYISAIVTPDNKVIAEKSEGDNSGWMYKVNGKIPNVNMSAYGLKNGDDITVFFTKDYTKESTSHDENSSGGGRTPSATASPAPSASPAPTAEPGATSAPSAPKFKDIDGHWAQNDINKMSEKGLMNGTEENIFSPDSTLSRAMFVTVLHRFEGEPQKEGSVFTDTEHGAWYEAAAAWANSVNIVNGVTDTEFAPNMEITREQMAAIIYRWTEYKGYDTDVKTELGYDDNSDISDYAKKAVAWVTENNIMNGCDNNLFMPGSYTTRAQAAAVFARITEKFGQTNDK